MAVSPVANSESFKITTPSDCEIELTRVFDAPRDLVFEAMSKPEHIKRWWGNLGAGYSVPVCEVDLRVEGLDIETGWPNWPHLEWRPNRTGSKQLSSVNYGH